MMAWLRSLRAAFVVLLIAALLAVIVRDQVTLRRASAAAAMAALKADSVEASRDTTRLVVVTRGKPEDSVRVWQRRAIQARQDADELDRQLQAERAARFDLSLTGDWVRRDTVVVLPDSGTAIDVRQPPIAVQLTGRGWSDDGRALVAVGVSLDTLRLEVRVVCSSENIGGVKAASVIVEAPVWASVRMDRVEQEPAVCNGSAVHRKRGLASRVAERVGVTIGYGIGRGGAGPVIGVGVRVWP